MLAKLIKHEWKSVYKVGSILLIVIFAVTLLGYIGLRTPVMSALFADGNNLTERQSILVVFASVSSLMIYVMLLVGAMYGIIIYMGVHFYKTMYTEQGYLTHTLPVKTYQLLGSKVLVSGVWVFLIDVALYLSVAVLVIGMLQGVMEGIQADIAWDAFWRELIQGLALMNFETAHFLIILILMLLISPFVSVILLFGALTIGQLSGKHKLMMGILVYIGITVANYILNSLVQAILSFRYAASFTDELPLSYMSLTYDISLIASCVVGAVICFVSHYIISKKLNLD